MKYIAIFLSKTGDSVINRVKSKSIPLGEGKYEIQTLKESKEISNYAFVGKKEFKPIQETIDFKGNPDSGSYFVYLSAYSYEDKNLKLYYYDYDSGDILNFNTMIKSPISPKNLSHFTGKKTVEHIIAGAKTVVGNPLIYMILPIIALVVGLIIGHFIMPQTVYVPLPQTTPNIPSV